MKNLLIAVLFAIALGAAAPLPVSASSSPPSQKDYRPLPKPGEKV